MFGKLLSKTLASTQLIHDVGLTTKSQLVVMRDGERPTLQRREELVHCIARAYWIAFGAWPSAARGAWFNAFVRAIGVICEAGEIGDRLSVKVVDLCKRDTNGYTVLMGYLLGSEELNDDEKSLALIASLGRTAEENHGHLLQILSIQSAD